MQAICISKDSRKLIICELAKPVLFPDEVLIKVAASGLNRADILQRKGKYPAPIGSSDILGLEVSGVIESCGVEVKNFKIGDRVCALLNGGGYANYVAVKALQVLKIPDNLDLVAASALPEVLATVWYNIFMLSQAQKGDSILIHGGASGVGSMAIKLAEIMGINCYSTVGNDDKYNFIKNISPNCKVYNYKNHDFVSSILKDTNNQGVDIILDIVGGDYFDKNLKLLKYQGKLICLSLLQGAKANVDFAPLIIKNLSIRGSTLRDKSTEIKAQIISSILQNIWKFVENGTLSPIIDKIFPYTEAQLAHDYMEKSLNCGKILLRF